MALLHDMSYCPGRCARDVPDRSASGVWRSRWQGAPGGGSPPSRRAASPGRWSARRPPFRPADARWRSTPAADQSWMMGERASVGDTETSPVRRLCAHLLWDGAGGGAQRARLEIGRQGLRNRPRHRVVVRNRAAADGGRAPLLRRHLAAPRATSAVEQDGALPRRGGRVLGPEGLRAAGAGRQGAALWWLLRRCEQRLPAVLQQVWPTKPSAQTGSDPRLSQEV